MKIAFKILAGIGLIIHIIGSVLYLIPYDMLPVVGLKTILWACFVYLIAYLINFINYNTNEDYTDGMASFQIILPLFISLTYGLGFTYTKYTVLSYFIYDVFFFCIVVFALIQKDNGKYHTCVSRRFKMFMKIMLIASAILFVKHSVLVQSYIAGYGVERYEQSNIFLDYFNNISTIALAYLFTIIYMTIKIKKRKEYMI